MFGEWFVCRRGEEIRGVSEVVDRESSGGVVKRTGWCCQFGGESTEAQGGSASGPWQASAWYGKTCGSVAKGNMR